MKGMFKLKKLSAVFITVLMLVHSTMCYAVAYDYSVGKAEFDIPDEFSVLYDEEDMPETEVFRFVDGNNTVELSCYFLSNGDEASFMFMNLTDTVEYFFDNVSAFDYSDFTFQSVQTWHGNGSSGGIMFEGTVKKSGKDVPIETYAFSTADNIYGFEFLIYNESARSLIDEIVNSIYINDAYSYIGEEDEYNADFEDMYSIFSFVIISVVGVLSVIIKSKSSSNKGKKSVNTTDASAQKPAFSKFELNGKNINALNERFTVGKRDDNFAQQELEKERRDRKNMFD
jgi:hypothetical protein